MLGRLKQQLACLALAPLAVFAAVAQEAYGQATEKRAPVIRITSVKSPENAVSVRYGVTRKDVARIEQMPNVRQAVPLRTFVGEMRHGDRKVKSRITGTTTQLAALRGLKMKQGRFLTAADVARFNNVAVIDSAAARMLFPSADAIGKNIRIGNHYFLIVGEIKTSAQSRYPPSVYVPISTMRSRMGDMIIERTRGLFEATRLEISEVLLSLDDPRRAAETLEAVKRLLAETHVSQDYSIKLTP